MDEIKWSGVKNWCPNMFRRGKSMKLGTLAAIVALAVAGLGAGTSSSKADVTYIVSGTFDDSTTLSGEFTVDVYGYVELYSLSLTTLDGTITCYAYTGATADPDGQTVSATAARLHLIWAGCNSRS